MATAALQVLSWAIALLAVPACAYLAALTLFTRAPAAPPPAPRRLRFAIVVPAHDEAAVIERTVLSLVGIDWPRELFRVVVIEHNCTDDTAARARAAGAQVLTRRNSDDRGKGDALVFAFGEIMARGWADALVVVDADTVVSANILEACAARLQGGERAVQVHNGVLNPADSWRTRLLAIALSCFHRVRSRARERLALSCGVRGTGWCIAAQALTVVPYRALSLTEDLEYGLELGLAGVRVAYADEAEVLSDMAPTAVAAAGQRQRWEHGRRQLVRRYVGRLLGQALRRPSRISADLALDLIVPPLSSVALLVAALAAVAGVLELAGGDASAWLWTALACAAALTLHVLRGWQLSGVGVEGLLDLARAPAFLAWKLMLMWRPHGGRWLRTDRDGRP